MRWSVQGMLGLVAVASVALALGQYSPVVSGIVLSSIVAAAWLVLPTSTLRRLAYGSVVGIVFMHLLLVIFVYARLGRLTASTYQESNEMHEISKPWRPYVGPVCALL